MRKSISIWMLGIAAMLASCSQNEDELQGVNDNDGMVRISVQLEDGMKTRAATQEESGESAGVTRFVLNAYEATEDGTIGKKATDVVITDLGNGNFTAKLDRQKYYKFFCWADEGENSSYTITDGDLENIALKQNTDGTADYMLPTIAHRGESSVVYGETANEVPIQLKHAVAKVMLQTTGTLGAGRAKLETKTCIGYNAVTNVYDNTTTKESVSKSGPEADVTGSEDKPAAVLQFYVLTGRTTENVVLTYTSSEGNEYTKNLNSVSFENDYRTIFVGDIARLQYNDVSVKAALDENWDEDINITLSDEATFDVTTHTITTHLEGQIADNPDLIKSAIDGGTSLAVTGPMNDGDLTAIADYLKENSGTTIDLDLSKAEITSIAEQAFYGVFIEGTSIDNRVKSLGKVSLPTTLTEIGDDAFRDCPSFTVANWDELTSLTTIGEGAFWGSGLSGNIILPGSITTIEKMAFYQTDITGIVFPSSITAIGTQMFYRCYSLTNVVFKGDVESLDIFVFGGCSALEEIDLSACTTVPTYPENGNPFSDILEANIEKITLKVKADLVDSFNDDANWGKCKVTAAE